MYMLGQKSGALKIDILLHIPNVILISTVKYDNYLLHTRS